MEMGGVVATDEKLVFCVIANRRRSRARDLALFVNAMGMKMGCAYFQSFFGRTCKPLKKQRPGVGGRMRCGTPEPPEPKIRLSECKIGGRCIIQGRNRTGCKRCRWEKCLQANMSRGSASLSFIHQQHMKLRFYDRFSLRTPVELLQSDVHDRTEAEDERRGSRDGIDC